jgi:hypothetical protein
MKVTIEFNVPDEQQRLEDFMDGGKWKYVVREVDERLREMLKWNGENLDESQLITVRQIRSMLLEYVEQENLNLYK